MWLLVACWVAIDVLEEQVASIFRAEEIILARTSKQAGGKQNATCLLASSCKNYFFDHEDGGDFPPKRRLQLNRLHCFTSRKMILFRNFTICSSPLIRIALSRRMKWWWYVSREGKQTCIQIFSRKHLIESLRRCDHGWGDNMKWYSMWRCGLDSTGSRYEPVADGCVDLHGDKLSSSMKDKERMAPYSKKDAASWGWLITTLSPSADLHPREHQSNHFQHLLDYL
jgi:hypothetical protein